MKSRLRLLSLIALGFMLFASLDWAGNVPALDLATDRGEGAQVRVQTLQAMQRVPLEGALSVPDDAQPWAWAPEGARALGFPREGLWTRGVLRNSSEAAQSRWLLVAEPFMDQVDCQTRDSEGLIHTYRTGDQRPYASRPILSTRFLIPLAVPARGQVEFHCYIRNNGSVTVAFEVWRPERYAQVDSELQFARALCYGALVFAIVCVMLVAWIQRQWLPVLLIAELFPVLLATTTREGDAFALLWPNTPAWNLPPFSLILVGLIAASVVFLRLVALNRVEGRIIRALIWGCALLLLPVLGFDVLSVQISEVVQYLSVLAPVTLVWICLRHWHEGFLPRIVAAGLTVQLVGLIVNAAGVLGYIASGYALASLYASVVKGGALAVAMAYRLKADRAERELAQANHLMELETRVAYEEQLRHAVSHHPRYGMPNQALLEESIRVSLPDVPAPGLAVWILRLNRFAFLESILPRDTLTDLVKTYAQEVSQWFVANGGPALLAIDGGHRMAALDDGTLCFVTVGEPHAQVQADLSGFVTRRFEHNGLFVAWDPHVGIGMLSHADVRTTGLTEEARVALQWCSAHRRVVRFDADRMKREQLAYGLTLDLEGAIERGELVLHYQPKIELPSRRTVSFEALVRWRHPVRGMIPPGAFIAEAEATGAINRLTMWAIREAARFLLTLPDESVRVSVNITAFDLATPHFVGKVLGILALERCPPNRLILEITESAALSDQDRATEILSELRAKGVQIALDDFGTGYSSLAILQEMPLDEMKVDRSFVTDIGEFERKQAVLEAMIEVGHRLGLTVTIEGVEHEESVEWLTRNGCDVVQGFVFSRPLEASVARDWVSRYGPDQSPAPAKTVSAAALRF
ncbi:MAG: EAL domain-containing protein [Acidobacteriota bacterium]